jgi:hypothetical protein
MKVKFPVGNDIFYGQDLVYQKGVPSGVEFDVDEHETYYVLTADGFGNFHNYGNGALYIYKSKLPNISQFATDLETCEACGGEK